MEAVPIIISVVFMLSTTTMIVFIRKFTNEERMAMIEKGADAKLFKSQRGFIALRFGLLLIGAGIGLLVGSILENTYRMEEEVAYFSMLFLFGGLGLSASHYLETKQRAKEDENN